MKNSKELLFHKNIVILLLFEILHKKILCMHYNLQNITNEYWASLKIDARCCVRSC